MSLANKETSTVRMAIVADIHNGHPEDRDGEFGTPQQWKAWFRGAQEAGAQILILGGDNTHTGLPREAKQLAKSARENFNGNIFAISGNHDMIEDKLSHVNAAMEEEGVTVLDDKAEIVKIKERCIGFVGMDGSLDVTRFNTLKDIYPDKEKRTDRIYDETEEKYGKIFQANLDWLRKAQVEFIIPIIHVPIHVDQYSDTTPPDRLRDMTPLMYKRILKVKDKVAVVVGGHVHSTKSASYRRDNPLYQTKEGVNMLNVAAPNAIRQGNNPIVILDVDYDGRDESKKVSVRRVQN